jgi:hypothetical protein
MRLGSDTLMPQRRIRRNTERNSELRRRFPNYRTRGNRHQARSMQTNWSKKEGHSTPLIFHPATIAMAVALFGIVAMLIVDHGPWTRPQVQSAHVAFYQTTGEAARAAGASVIPTESGDRIEPATPGPKPAKPINPASP